jgi:hypothetical protein
MGIGLKLWKLHCFSVHGPDVSVKVVFPFENLTLSS